MVTIRPRGRSSLPNSKGISCLLGKTVTMLKAFHLARGSLCHYESMVSMEKTIPLGDLHMKSFQWYLETLLISSVSGYSISWVFGSGIIFTGGLIVQF